MSISEYVPAGLSRRPSTAPADEELERLVSPAIPLLDEPAGEGDGITGAATASAARTSAPTRPAGASATSLLARKESAHKRDMAPATRSSSVVPRYLLDVWHRIADVLAVLAVCLLVGGANPWLTAGVVILGLFLAPNLYRHRLTLSILDNAPRAACVGAVVAFVAAVLTNPGWTVSRGAAYGLAIAAALVVARIVATPVIRWRRRRSRTYRHRTLVVGTHEETLEITRALMENREYGLEPVALVDSIGRTGESRGEALGLPVVGISKGLVSLVERFRAQTVIIGFSDIEDREILRVLRQCVREDAEVFIVPRLYDYVGIQGSMDRIKTFPLIRLRRAAHRSLGWRLKRPIGFLLASLAMLALLPVFAVLSIAVKIEDRESPIFFRQRRIGEDGKEFELLKFRSMVPPKNGESDTHWNGATDPRITKFGAFMRKYSLDELPQIYNVVKGEMAIVGPRPERPHFVDKFGSTYFGYRDRHRVPVGLTGLAAINGLRGDTGIRERAMYDNFYIENWSLWLDAKIILSTFKAVFVGTGS